MGVHREWTQLADVVPRAGLRGSLGLAFHHIGHQTRPSTQEVKSHKKADINVWRLTLTFPERLH